MAKEKGLLQLLTEKPHGIDSQFKDMRDGKIHGIESVVDLITNDSTLSTQYNLIKSGEKTIIEAKEHVESLL